jgi:hypothetical protein
MRRSPALLSGEATVRPTLGTYSDRNSRHCLESAAIVGLVTELARPAEMCMPWRPHGGDTGR